MRRAAYLAKVSVRARAFVYIFRCHLDGGISRSNRSTIRKFHKMIYNIMNAISYKLCEISVVQYGFSIEFISKIAPPQKIIKKIFFSFPFNRNHSNAIDNEENRHKRGVVELYSMVKCSTGCDPLIYKGYGCYCGFLGRGRALDGIDRYDH